MRTATRVDVAFLDLRPATLGNADAIHAALARVVASGRYLLGDELAGFEAEWAAHVGAVGAAGVGSGLAALVLALRAHGIGPGDEVLVPSSTFVATWLAVDEVGAVPVPVEPDARTGLVTAAGFRAALTRRTRAIVPVHLYGNPAEPDAVQDLGDEHGLVVVHDSAQAHGARTVGGPVGTRGTHCWSFYPGKNLGALGDGGAVTSDDATILERVRRLRNYGSSERYVHVERGTNSRLDELQAAVLRVRLLGLEAANDRRRAIAATYDAALWDLAGGRYGWGGPVPVPQRTVSSRHLYVVRAERRDALQTALAAHGVPTLIHYPTPPHAQSAYADRRLTALPVAEDLAATVLSLPIGPHLDLGTVRDVAAVVRQELCT